MLLSRQTFFKSITPAEYCPLQVSPLFHSEFFEKFLEPIITFNDGFNLSVATLYRATLCERHTLANISDVKREMFSQD